MAFNQRTRLPQTTIESDRAALLALKKLADYAPANPALSVDAVSTLEARLRQAEEAERLAANALAAARDAHITAGWDLHNVILSVKAAVISQYGHSSDAVFSIGLKKKADYRRPRRRPGSTTS
ncbi:MAG: hypothetical protein IPP13_08275 [Kouleothrix sp.]|nr:hypothetical protein [Kouleothrix sp.]